MAMKISFDHKHYVPILRFRKAEMEALGWLPSEDKRRLTPLIELPPILLDNKLAKALRNDEFYNRLAKRLAKSWGYLPIFIDGQFIEAHYKILQQEHPIMFLAESTRSLASR